MQRPKRYYSLLPTNPSKRKGKGLAEPTSVHVEARKLFEDFSEEINGNDEEGDNDSKEAFET